MRFAWKSGRRSTGARISTGTSRTSTGATVTAGGAMPQLSVQEPALAPSSEAAIAAHSAYALLHPDKPLHFEYSTTSGVPSA